MSIADSHVRTSLAAKGVGDALPLGAEAHGLHRKGSKESASPRGEKSEDGSQTTVIGEGRVKGSTVPLVITESTPPAGHPSGSPHPHGVQRTTSFGSGGETGGTASPRMAKQYLLQRRTSGSELHLSPRGTPTKLDAPIDPLLAPLDCPRPNMAAEQASSPAGSASTDASNQPHALEAWESLRASLVGKQLVVFLDYDGTLTPIVSDPNAAIITEQQRHRLAALASKCPVAIVTGRKLETIKNFLHRNEPLAGLNSLFFAGSHGFDIDCPGSTPAAPRHSKTVAEEFLPHLAAVRDEIAAKLHGMPGSLVEDNTFTVSVHYRNVTNEADRARLHQTVRDCMRPYEAKGLLRLTAGKEVHEIRAAFDWHKGAAVNYLLQLMCAELQSDDSQQIVPIYVGDDTTDEDAFRTLRAYRTSGTHPFVLSVFVRSDDKARPSAASHVLRSPEEVGQLLERLANL